MRFAHRVGFATQEIQKTILENAPTGPYRTDVSPEEELGIPVIVSTNLDLMSLLDIDLKSECLSVGLSAV